MITKRLFRAAAILIALSLATALPAFAQGVQTGTVTGLVQTADGATLPGVTVKVKSPTLQGVRTAVTDSNGVYFVRGLPAGTYSVTFEMRSFQPATSEIMLPLGGTVEVDTIMQLETVTELVTVTAESPTPLATTTVRQTFTKREIDALPVGRTPAQIAELAPGLTNNTPNTGQVTIAGAFSYDNVFMLNGVDINDNLFGSPHNLFIEDAIQETNVLTNGISAEWGRFSGGVINLVTKSGGNTFSGSFRESFQNPDWVGETPREKSANINHQDVLGKTHEGTFGGPVFRDRLWFFAAGRYEKSNTPNTTVDTNVAYTTTVQNKRGEIKVTATPFLNQTFTGSYLNNSTEQANTSGLGATLRADPNILVTRQLPNRLFALNYNGVIGNNFFATVQYSEKKFGFRNTGGTSTVITDSPFRSRGVASGVPSDRFYNAPYFDSSDPENRNNSQLTGSVAYSLSTDRLGSHDLKAGLERYVSTRTGGNSQTSTGYVVRADWLVSGGVPVLDSRGTPVPIWVPGTTRIENWLPTRGAQIDVRTTSLYVQDRWNVMPRLTLDLGARFEAVRTEATGDIVTADTNTLVPRLGATFDLEGNGRTVLQATYAHYAGKYSERQFGANTDVGNPSQVVYGYTGPAGQGMNFAPGFDLSNYATVIGGSFPTANIFAADDYKSPTTREFTIAVGHALGDKGHAKVSYEWRNQYDFVEDFIRLSDGQTTVVRNGVTFGTFNNVIWGNTDLADRDYQGMIFQSNYRFSDTATIGGHYTLQIRNHGNYTGEAANQPGNPSWFDDYPEILGPSIDRLQPFGRLPTYQRHKLRLYGIYTQHLGRFGALDLSPIWRVNSGTTYSLAAANVPPTAIELSRNPGYPAANVNTSAPARTLYFGERGSEDFKGFGLLDLSATYSIPIWKTLKPWIKAEIYNVLNNDKLIQWDTTVTRDTAGPVDANGLPTAFIEGARFGTATADSHYPQWLPGENGLRTFRMAFGIRF